MNKIKQRIWEVDENGDQDGVAGDCLKTAVACVLDVDYDFVPHFCNYPDALDPDLDELDGVGPLWWWALSGWARAQGYAVRIVPAGDPDFAEEVVKYEKVLLSGRSPRGEFLHTIVVQPEVWDPHPSNAGILDVSDAIVFKPIFVEEDDEYDW